MGWGGGQTFSSFEKQPAHGFNGIHVPFWGHRFTCWFFFIGAVTPFM
jgi:hypothetical protein